MKLNNIRVFHNPKRDAMMLVHSHSDGQGVNLALDRTADIVQAVSGWVLKESWDGQARLPIVLGWFKRIKAKLRKERFVHVATGDRYAALLKNRVIHITVDVFEDTDPPKEAS